ncbi:MAG: isoleucine--tRNA ligase [Candidatus Nanoarchaeia archaeon]|jgi:isoleucyl-tRNA synthetase|nr:isoleucine--tRNA ligase [Candidatus Nanoarchaeia archaeon]|tara:strand:- start:17592 stop:20384 length:2793 start_codon:yes stop_codon:yes gene_type:complete
MYDIQKVELDILNFWEKNKIFNKLRKKNKGKKRWSFLDGPITANNPMGVHHAWGRTYKDLYHRFKSSQGFDIRFQNGFDCQGLWVEREEEKDLELKNKEDIEKFGILKFVKACKKRVEKFSKVQEQQSIRLGQWMDWENSYYTMSDTNNLHNWHLFKIYFEKKWLYKGKDAVPWCWRCGTASSKHDIVTEGYKEVTHQALFMRFPLKNKKNEYFLIFTTTPWTVPADTAIAVNANLIYIKIKQDDNYYWLAEKRVEELKGEYTVIEKVNGKKLEGIGYEMPYSDLDVQKKVDHKVVLWDLASEEEGTGIVHIAPGCGSEDFDLGKKLNLSVISPLNDAGVYTENFGLFSKKKYSQVNKEVLKDLEENGFIYKLESYKHRYPHCWRCGEELVFRLVDEWYIKASEIRPKLIKENKKIKWYPEYGKVRQEDWFNNMSDWLISRKRYWGLPLPIWECSCGEIEVIGSLKELKEKAVDKKKVDNLPEIHRPWIDDIKIKCKKCKKQVSRIQDVGDAWLDAGITPLSTLGPYLDNKEEWKKWFPADMISENLPGQYRGWFNSLFWASISITGKAPFKSLFGYETLKDEKGEEMHKSKGNAIWFDDAVEKVGADSMRLLYCLQNPSLELRFGFNNLKEPKNNINILYNMGKLVENGKKKKYEIEDKWILSKFNSLIEKVTTELESLHPHLAVNSLQDFWLNELSRGYIQFVRDRLAEGDETSKTVLSEVYLNLIKLCGPIIPFVTEKIYQDLKKELKLKEESIHLNSWPKENKKLIDKKLEENFELGKKVMQEILSERENAKIGIRWPLSKAEILVEEPTKIKSLQSLIENQTNIKKLILKKGKLKVKLDTKLTKELEQEGFARELTRRIQNLRKKSGLKKQDSITLNLNTNYDLGKFIEELKDKVGAKSLTNKLTKTSLKQNIKGKEFLISISKI